MKLEFSVWCVPLEVVLLHGWPDSNTKELRNSGGFIEMPGGQHNLSDRSGNTDEEAEWQSTWKCMLWCQVACICDMASLCDSLALWSYASSVPT